MQYLPAIGDHIPTGILCLKQKKEQRMIRDLGTHSPPIRSKESHSNCITLQRIINGSDTSVYKAGSFE